MIRTVVRNTRGLTEGDTVARLLPDGEASPQAFRIETIEIGMMIYQGAEHVVYHLSGITAPFGKTMVKMITTENVAWCVSR